MIGAGACSDAGAGAGWSFQIMQVGRRLTNINPACQIFTLIIRSTHNAAR